MRKKYLLTLFRQGVYFNNSEPKDEEPGRNKKSCFFSSDYFDKLVIEEIGTDEEMAVFIGMKQNCYQAIDVIAVHNYALFQDIDSTEIAYANDIFSEENKDFPYFALIHVYVNPDILAGVSERYYKENYMNYFEQDLKETVSLCNEKLDIMGMVFKTLSASDFIIIVRGKNPEAIFSVSTAVRRKKIRKEKKTDEYLSVYKTYTILTLNGSGLFIAGGENEQNGKASTVGEVAIRGRYSNRYWSQKDRLEKKLTIPDSLNNLNGRYDFVLHLSLNDFLKIYSLLCYAKGINSGRLLEIKEEERSTYSKELLYLYDLIKGSYLSYFNERYLVGSVSVSKLETIGAVDYLKDIFLEETYDTSKFMFDSNNEKCNKVIERIKMVRDKLTEICCYRKSLPGSLDLLTNLAFLCQHVNGLSDIRIYVISLLKQMNLVLDSLENWIEIYQDDKKDMLLNFMEDYLRQSVVSLEEYGNIIRNNNFQTLQSPRYNVVTGISMEKFLIGYSRFLCTLMNYCYKNLGMNNSGNRTYYLPVMVPQLSKDTLSIEVVFPEWQVTETSKSCPKEENRYLMLVEGPANAEIVDVSYIVTTFFHEIAHQLRYETREVRNEVLLRIVIEDMADSLIRDLFTIVVEAETGAKNSYELQADFVKNFSDLLEKLMQEELKSYSNWSLENYKCIVQEKLQDFLVNMKRDNNQVMAMVNSFINDTNEYICNDLEMIELLVDISKNLQLLTGEYDWEKEKEEAEKLEDAANIEELKKHFYELLEKDFADLEKTIKEILIKDIRKYTAICQKNNPDMEDDIKNSFEKSKEAVISNIKEAHLLKKKMKKREDFYNDFYKATCKSWMDKLKKENSDKKEHALGRKKEWIRQGRKFGIDYRDSKSNKDKFSGYLEKAFNISDKYEFERAMKRISLYREETSDLFMCGLCDLDLISYLSVSAHGYPIDNGRYEDGYIERLTDVILIQWCLNDESDIHKLEQHDLCGQDLFGGVWRKLNPEDMKEYEDADELILNLKEYAQKENVALKKNVANLSRQILEQAKKQISWFRKRKYLTEDYLRGKQEYKKLRKKFEKEEEYGIKTIVSLCEINKEYLESLGEADFGLKESYQTKCEDFVLENYYFDKILNAKMEVDNVD